MTTIWSILWLRKASVSAQIANETNLCSEESWGIENFLKFPVMKWKSHSHEAVIHSFCLRVKSWWHSPLRVHVYHRVHVRSRKENSLSSSQPALHYLPVWSHRGRQYRFCTWQLQKRCERYVYEVYLCRPDQCVCGRSTRWCFEVFFFFFCFLVSTALREVLADGGKPARVK